MSLMSAMGGKRTLLPLATSYDKKRTPTNEKDRARPGDSIGSPPVSGGGADNGPLSVLFAGKFAVAVLLSGQVRP